MVGTHMPTRTGVSHALSAMVVLLLSPFIQIFAERVIDDQEIVPALEAVAQAIANHPRIPYATDTVTTLVFFSTVGLITFIWGVAYHLNRHGIQKS